MAQAVHYLTSFTRSQFGVSSLGAGALAALYAYASPDRMITAAAAGAFALLGTYALCTAPRKEPEHVKVARKQLNIAREKLNETLEYLFVEMKAFRALEQECSQHWKNTFHMAVGSFRELGGEEQLPEMYKKLHLLQTWRDNKDLTTTDIQLYYDISLLSYDINNEIRSRKDFLIALGRYSLLLERLQTTELVFGSLMTAELERVRGLLKASAYSRNGFNLALDQLFTAPHETDLSDRYSELLTCFREMAEEVSQDQRKEFLKKFQVLKELVDTSQPIPFERTFFDKVSAVQGRVHKITSGSDFNEVARAFRALATQSRQSHFAFEPLIIPMLRDIRAKLLASPFNKRG
ncbi:MAG TPA: hypothetical protein VLG44_01805 [Chlamydiales bacterium]|nr:hypothetical protein [Chlamydiales bacterium]